MQGEGRGMAGLVLEVGTLGGFWVMAIGCWREGSGEGKGGGCGG